MDPATSRPRRRVLVSLAILALLFLTGEVVTRVKTVELASGVRAVKLGAGQLVPLLPLKPSRAVAEGWLAASRKARFIMPDAELGWSVARASQSEVPSSLGRPVVYTSNAQGFRAASERVYAPEIPAGKRRVIALGDSFTFGAEVDDADTWPARLEALDPRLEAVNLGVQSYGVDQAFLRWRRDGQPLAADLVVLAIWPEDMCRSLNLTRGLFATEGGYLMVKPRFVLASGALRLVNSPVPSPEEMVELVVAADPARFPAPEFWLDPAELHEPWFYASRLARTLASFRALVARRKMRARLYSGEERAAYDLTLAIARSFCAEVEQRGARALILLLPQTDLMQRFPRDEDFPLVRELRAAGLDVLNCTPAFLAASGARLFLPSNHLTPAGNALVAREVHAFLEAPGSALSD